MAETTPARARRTLRREATALQQEQLSKGQAEAAETLLSLLDDAAERSARADDVDRRNHILLLDGERGAGKSSLVRALARWMDPKDQRTWTELEALRDSGWKNKDRKNKNQEEKALTRGGVVHRRALSMHEEVDWLEPLSLDPSAPGTNLVAAVFSRIMDAGDRAITRDDRFHRQGMLEAVSPIDRALNELENLRTHAVMALEGNLEGRRNTMDPEAYATHTR
jgi:energy-coupling factor transporter ATP-binding protein EcfA2